MKNAIVKPFVKPSNRNPISFAGPMLVLALGLMLPACTPNSGTPVKETKKESPAAAPADFAGTYKLVTLNGNKLPFTPPHEGGAPEVQSGSMTLNADGTHSCVTTFKVPSGQTMNREVTGTFTREGAKFTMQWKGAGTTTATLEGNTFTMNNEGVLFAYQK